MTHFYSLSIRMPLFFVVVVHFVAGGLLNPIDVIKIRMQNHSPAYPWPERGVLASGRRILREEGLRGLERGLSATLMREILYSTIRMGAYEPILHMINHNGNAEYPSPAIKFLSALLSGAIGAALANPTDLVKVQIQATMPGGTATPLPYSGAIEGFRYIYRNHGVQGLFRGATPTMARAAVLTSAQIGSYDSIKNNILRQHFGVNDGYQLHFGASLLAGLITTTASNPGYSNSNAYVASHLLNALQFICHQLTL
jgi:hypothetical protein